MTMPDQQQDVTAEIRRLVTASKLPTRQETARIEAKAPDIAPFEEQVHSLLNDSIEKIAQGWIDQLKALKENCDALESQVLAAVTKTKDHIAKLHELGNQVAEEAKRGRELCAKLSDGIAQITGPETGSEITLTGDFDVSQEGRSAPRSKT